MVRFESVRVRNTVEHGADAAIARVDTEKAAREAERDCAALLEAQGDDANAAGERVEIIRSRG